MNKEKIGQFIKQLREEKGLTQEELASKIYISRSTLSHIELGHIFPSHDKIISLSKELNVSVMELYTAQKLDNPNEATPEFYNYLKHLNTKLKKCIFTIISIIIIFIITFLFYYFITSYNTIKMYKITGESNNFAINIGSLFINKDKIILTLAVKSNNNSSIKGLNLKYNKNNSSKLLATTTSSYIYLEDKNGYNEYFNYKDLIKMNGNFSLEIVTDTNKETIKLYLEQEYTNKNLFSKETLSISNESNSIKEEPLNIPDNIIKKFKNNNGIYTYNIKEKSKEIDLYYYKTTGLFVVNEIEGKTVTEWLFLIGTTNLHYSKSENKKLLDSFNIDIKNMNYQESKLYDYFKINYFDKYLSVS